MVATLAILCTCPDPDTARRLAHGLVAARLAACVNILPGVTSVYRWQDAVEETAETLLVIKTSAARSGEVEAWLAANHPYEVPELLVLEARHVAEPYRQWLHASVSA